MPTAHLEEQCEMKFDPSDELKLPDFAIEEKDDDRTWLTMNHDPIKMDCDKVEEQQEMLPPPVLVVPKQPAKKRKNKKTPPTYPSDAKVTKKQFDTYYEVLGEVLGCCGKIASAKKSNGEHYPLKNVKFEREEAVRKLTGIINSIGMQAGYKKIDRSTAYKIVEALSYHYRDIYEDGHASDYERVFDDDIRRKAWRRQIAKNKKNFTMMSVWDIERKTMH